MTLGTATVRMKWTHLFYHVLDVTKVMFVYGEDAFIKTSTLNLIAKKLVPSFEMSVYERSNHGQLTQKIERVLTNSFCQHQPKSYSIVKHIHNRLPIP
jgi:hypothetical protein